MVVSRTSRVLNPLLGPRLVVESNLAVPRRVANDRGQELECFRAAVSGIISVSVPNLDRVAGAVANLIQRPSSLYPVDARVYEDGRIVRLPVEILKPIFRSHSEGLRTTVGTVHLFRPNRFESRESL